MRHALFRALQLSHARCDLLIYFRMLPAHKRGAMVTVVVHGVIGCRAKPGPRTDASRSSFSFTSRQQAHHLATGTLAGLRLHLELHLSLLLFSLYRMSENKYAYRSVVAIPTQASYK